MLCAVGFLKRWHFRQSGRKWTEGTVLGLVSHLVGSDGPAEWPLWAGQSHLHPTPALKACLSGLVIWCPFALIPGLWPLANSFCPIPGGHRAEGQGGAGLRRGIMSVRTVTPCTPRNQAISSHSGTGHESWSAMSPRAGLWAPLQNREGREFGLQSPK